MSERLPNTGQHEADITSPEILHMPSPEHHEKQPRHHEADPAIKAAHARHEAAHTAETASKPLERLEAAAVDARPIQPLNVNRELKAITLRRELKNIQRKLPAPQRVLSKLIHQPAVRVTSEIAGKTITRPSGFLGGSLVAFLGTSIYLYMAKDGGFSYNYFVFLALFAGGFIVGLILEYLVYLATVSHRQRGD